MTGTEHFWTYSWTFRCRFVCQGQGIAHLVKVSKTWGPCRSFQNDGRRGTICKDACRVAGAVQETCSSEILGGQGTEFLRRVALWSIRSSGCATMFLHDRCSTSYDLALLFPGRRSTLDRWSGNIAKYALVRGRQLCTQRSIFEGSIAELICFWSCQLGKLRRPRRIASFLTLSSSKVEEVSPNGFVFDAVNLKNGGSLAE